VARYTGILPNGLTLVTGGGIGALRQKDVDDGRVDFHTQWSTWAAAAVAGIGEFGAWTDKMHPDWSLPLAYTGLGLLAEKMGEWVVQRVAGVSGAGGGYDGLTLLDGGSMGDGSAIGAQPLARML